MKARLGGKAFFLIIGFLFAWLAIFIMLADFYEGQTQLMVSIIEGGTYEPYFLRGPGMMYWLIFMGVSSIFLGIGFTLEEVESRNPV